jgi:hypothetical protein
VTTVKTVAATTVKKTDTTTKGNTTRP